MQNTTGEVIISYNQEGSIYLIVQEKLDFSGRNQVKMSIEEAREVIKEMELKYEP